MSSRRFLSVNGIRLAYHDWGEGDPILALHGHFGRGMTWARLASDLNPGWRLVALDQRGHGWSDQPGDYSREAYVADAAAAIRALDLAPAVVLGHSMGGINAYQLAARHPDLVRALIIEDIGAATDHDSGFLAEWPERFPSYRALEAFLAARTKNPAYFLESAVEREDGWGFRFRYDHLRASMELCNGDWWDDWLASDGPALLIHGDRSWAVSTEHQQEMAARRPNTRLVVVPGVGHAPHDEAPEAFAEAVRAFLATL